MTTRIIKLFLRLSISAGFLSAVADRFGWWSVQYSVWGSWDKFVEYTQLINPWFPSGLVAGVAAVATAAEIVFAIFLLFGFKTELFATLSGFLMLAFGLSMAFSIGIKAPLDYSVFSAAAGAFALGLMKEKYLEIDSVLAAQR